MLVLFASGCAGNVGIQIDRSEKREMHEKCLKNNKKKSYGVR